jgi:hypothetical protein
MAVRNMPDPERKTARLPPRWFIRLAWITHRRLYRWTGGRRVAAAALQPNVAEISGVVMHDR